MVKLSANELLPESSYRQEGIFAIIEEVDGVVALRLNSRSNHDYEENDEIDVRRMTQKVPPNTS